MRRMDTTKPLTPDMQAALARLVRTQSVALVRLWGQWWVAEQDVREGLAASVAGSGSLDPECETFQTRTVKGLVDRGVLRFAKPAANMYGRVVPHRAEFDHRHK